MVEVFNVPVWDRYQVAERRDGVITENTDEDSSFGLGGAQFLTGEL